MQIVYVGPHDGVDVAVSADASVTVMNGQSADFPPDVAESLLAQGDAHWREKAPFEAANWKKKEG